MLSIYISLQPIRAPCKIRIPYGNFSTITELPSSVVMYKSYCFGTSPLSEATSASTLILISSFEELETV